LNVVRKSSKCSSTNRKRVVSPANVTAISDARRAFDRAGYFIV
jgi:hypothetical protein